MKTASLATALFLILGAAWAPQAVWSQDAQPAPEAPGLGIQDEAGSNQDAPASEVLDQADDTIQPGVEVGGQPANGEAASSNIEGAPPAESVVEGTIEAAPAKALFTMPDLPVIGKPVPGGVNYQPAVTEVAHDVHWLSNWVHGVMAAIVLLVVALLAIVAVRFNSRSNPTPARFTHNTRVEIAWTLGPVLILILIGSFSLPILFKELEIPDPDLTVKVTGNQWYWSYEYPDNEFSYDSIMLARDELADYGYSDDLYLLAPDTALVVPVGAVVKLQTTGSDVIHSWAMPAFGVKMDAIPGRLNETWFRVEEPGVYFGQCSELCGKDHAYMPIAVKALAPDDFAAWLDWAIDEYGGARGPANVALAN